jgi:hypothetical protein
MSSDLSRPIGLFILVCLALGEPFAGRSTAAGQSRDPPAGDGDRLVVDLALQLGALALTGEEREMAYVSDARVLTLDEVDSKLTLGFSARVGRARSAWRVGVSLLRAPTSETMAEYTCRRDLEVPCGGGVGRGPVDFAVTLATLDAELAPARERAGLSSFAVAGLGVRQYSVRWPGSLTWPAGSEIRTSPSGKVGGGFRWRWTHAAMSLRAEDHMGWARDPGPGFTHDVILGLAFEWRPR